MVKKEMKIITRRAFLEALGGVVIFGIGGFSLILSPSRCSHEKDETPCLEAITDEEKTIAALIDTVVPGRETDPEGSPGALEACALNLAYDPFFPLVSLIPAIVTLLNSISRRKYQSDFVSLNLKQRTEVLASAEEKLPPITLALRFIRSTFYTDLYNRIGYEYLGYPGPNVGYVYDGFSFGVPMSKEMTPNGNLP